jgi:hypothetical protein
MTHLKPFKTSYKPTLETETREWTGKAATAKELKGVKKAPKCFGKRVANAGAK